MSEKGILINGMIEKLEQGRAKQIWKTEIWQTRKYQSRQNASLKTTNRFAQL